MSWTAALVLTLVVEVPLYAVSLGWLARTPRRAAAYGTAVNLVSHPVLWFLLLPRFEGFLAPVTALVVGEAVVVAAEFAALAATLRDDPVAVAAAVVVANGTSFLAGVWLGA